MSVAKRKKPYEYPRQCEAADRQESLRAVKIQAEQLKEKLQKSVMDNPQFTKKAALLISLWAAGKDLKSSKKKTKT